jgi:tetratricopeptide (TPR) repeat protein
MTTANSPRWRIIAPVLILVLAGLGVGGYFLYQRHKLTQLPEPGSVLYKEYLHDFQIGLAALDVGQTEIANEKLTAAIDKVPEEPAAWANRGLLHLRQMELDEARKDLAQAQKLAPENSEIETLIARIAEQQGNFQEAEQHLTKAVSASPHNIANQYLLAQMIERDGQEGNEAKRLAIMEQILKEQPNNLVVLKEKARLAAGLGEKKALLDALAQLKRLSKGWSPATVAELAEVEKASEGPFGIDFTIRLAQMANLMVIEPAHKQSLIALNQAQDQQIGPPLYNFLRMQPVRPAVAPADFELTFEVELQSETNLPPDLKEIRASTVLPIWLTRQSTPVLFVANEDEVRRLDEPTFREAFPSGAKKVPPSSVGVLPIDWNNDYKMDLLLSGAGGLRFLQQQANGTFADVTAKTGLDLSVLTADYFGAWAADFEMDGDLDIIVGPRFGEPFVLRNNGDGTFKVIKPFTGVTGLRDFVWADFDNDGAPDAAMLDNQGKLHIFANERGGVFRKVTLPDPPGKVLAITAIDADNYGALDVLILADNTELLVLSQHDGAENPWKITPLANWLELRPNQEPGDVRLQGADVDNNGGVDVIASGKQGTQIFLKDADGRLKPLGRALPDQVLGTVDLNKEGRLDILGVSAKGRPVRWKNHGKKNYSWQVVRPKGDENEKGDRRINSYGIGGEIEVRSGLVVQKQMIKSPDVHFGLGDQDQYDVLRIIWPNGSAQLEFDKPVKQYVEARQRLGGSCPFLFTNDGQGMQFVTDCTWSTPLGMYINAQDKGGFLQTTDWVKIRGDQLVPTDGVYDVRITANLWETHFLDYMTLMVVDHPPETEIYVDERFALTPSEPHFVVTKPAKPVKLAWDDDGNDVTEIVSKIDGQYLDNFGRGKYQGVTRDHYVEIDLGEQAPRQGPVYLLANGWIHPTDSSINVAISQGSNEPPHPIVLEVPDGKGGWKIGRNDVGFPAGKNKTIVIRLDGIGGNPDVARRVRLRTNMEIYWDALLYAEGMETSLAKQKVMKPDSAELRYHGISLITTANPSSPELPHYDKLVSRRQYWRDLIGFHTRFGDVRELLDNVDDRYVIMNAGDELAFTFKAPEAPSAGWKRDFVWISDGWVKDGNLNTRFSKTVLPLPYHEMKDYITPPGRLQDDPVYKRVPEDWKKYHTRYVTPDEFKRGLRLQKAPQP